MQTAIQQPPPLMTRRELADYLNQQRIGSRDQISVRMVKHWEEEGLLRPHRAFAGKRGRTVRYTAGEVRRFLEDIV